MFKINNNFFLAIFILFSATQAFCPKRKRSCFIGRSFGDLAFLNPRASVPNNSLGTTPKNIKKALEAAEWLLLVINERGSVSDTDIQIPKDQKEDLKKFINSDLFAFYFKELFLPIFSSDAFEDLLQKWLCEKNGAFHFTDSKEIVKKYLYRGMLIDGKLLLFQDKTCQHQLMFDFFNAVRFHCLTFRHEENCQGCGTCFSYKLVQSMINDLIFLTLCILDKCGGWNINFENKFKEAVSAYRDEHFEFFSLTINELGDSALSSCVLNLLDNYLNGFKIEFFIPEKDRKLDWYPTFLDSPMVGILKSDIKFDI